MEYLDPSTWQTLYQFFDSTKAKVVDLQPRTALNTIIKTLESKKYVHGDLQTDVIEEPLDLRVIEFD